MHTYTYIHTYIDTYLYVILHLCPYIHTNLPMHVCLHTCIHTSHIIILYPWSKKSTDFLVASVESVGFYFHSPNRNDISFVANKNLYPATLMHHGQLGLFVIDKHDSVTYY